MGGPTPRAAAGTASAAAICGLHRVRVFGELCGPGSRRWRSCGHHLPRRLAGRPPGPGGDVPLHRRRPGRVSAAQERPCGCGPGRDRAHDLGPVPVVRAEGRAVLRNRALGHRPELHGAGETEAAPDDGCCPRARPRRGSRAASRTATRPAGAPGGPLESGAEGPALPLAVDAVHLAWAGSTERKRPHCHRPQEPRLPAEWDDDTEDGGDHAHPVWRHRRPTLDPHAVAVHRAEHHSR
jgi:hypothetical protein